MSELRYAVRQLARRPGFTAVVVLTLAVGIGLNSVMFSLLDRMGMRELSIREPARIVTINDQGKHARFAYLDRIDFRDQCRAFEDVVAVTYEMSVRDYLEIPRPVPVKIVSRNYFEFLGVKPAAGRFFSETDSPELVAERVVVISHGLWRRDFGGDPSVIGRSVQLDGRTVTIAGVTIKGFTGTGRWDATEVWYPAETWFHSTEAYVWRQPQLIAERRYPQFTLLARLRPGVTLEAAQVEADRIMQNLATTYPRPELERRPAVLSPIDESKRSRYLQGLAGMAFPGLVLAIACANISGLLIARSHARSREVAVRLALGSGRFRLVRQLLTESLLLAIAGGVAAMVLAFWAIRSVPALLPPSPELTLPDFHLDGRVVVFMAGLSVLTSVLFGLIPAWVSTRPDLVSLLNGGVISRAAGRRFSGLNLLIIGQLALSLLLLMVAGLFVGTFEQRLQGQAWLQKSDRLLVEMKPALYGLEPSQIPRYLEHLQARLGSLPGIKQLSILSTVPFNYFQSGGIGIYVPASTTQRSGRALTVACNAVAGNIDETMGTRLLHGRSFTPDDARSDVQVALISQAAAAAFWPNADPVGQQLRLGTTPDAKPCEVIGVVEDAPYNQTREGPRPYLIFPIRPEYCASGLTLMIETTTHPNAMIPFVQEEIRRLNARVRPVNIQSLHERIRTHPSVSEARFWSEMFGVMGILGMGLAAVGLYAVVTFAVSRRTREIGVRMAIGAGRNAILWMVLKRGLKLVLAGILLGLPLAAGIVRWICSVSTEFTGIHPLGYAAVTSILAFAALLAACIPARRASKVDPMVALRCE